MENIWSDVLTKLQSIPLPSGVTYDDIISSSFQGETGNIQREESQGRPTNPAQSHSSSHYRDEDDEDYSTGP